MSPPRPSGPVPPEAGRDRSKSASSSGIRQVDGLAAAMLEGALDDFTGADLTQADLAGRDLVGVRWSEHGTRWPPGTDTGRLRARSREVDRQAGIYVIERPDDSDKLRYAPT